MLHPIISASGLIAYHFSEDHVNNRELTVQLHLMCLPLSELAARGCSHAVKSPQHPVTVPLVRKEKKSLRREAFQPCHNDGRPWIDRRRPVPVPLAI